MGTLSMSRDRQCLVPQLFLNVGVSGYRRCAKDAGGSRLRTTKSGRSIFLQAFADPRKPRGGHILKVGDNRDGSAERTRLACVGSERTRKRDPKNAAELLGGTHRMGTTMQIADAIKPLNREREQGEKRVEEHTVFLMVASVFKTIAALGIVEPLVF